MDTAVKQIESPTSLREVPAIGMWSRVMTGDNAVTLFLFVAACGYLWLFRDFTTLNGDEGIVLQGAQRILSGKVLYRDFFSFYTPGSYYFTALIAKLFGNSMQVARTTLVLFGGMFAVLTYSLTRRICSRWSAMAAAVLSTLTCLPYRFLVTHWDATAVAFLTLYFAVLWIEKGRLAHGFLLGSFSALTFLFEQPKGMGLLLGLAAGIGVIVWRGPMGRLLWRQAPIIAAGFLWPFALTCGYFAKEHALTEMFADWAWPIFHYSITNSLPYGFVLLPPSAGSLWHGDWIMKGTILLISGSFLLITILPFIAVIVFGWSVIRRFRGVATDGKWQHLTLVSATLCGLLISILEAKRADFTHIVYLAPLFYLVVAWIFDGLGDGGKIWRQLRPVLVLYVFLSAVAFGITTVSIPLSSQHNIHTARGWIKIENTDNTLDPVAGYLSGEKTTFVYPYEPMYYYLTGTFSPTRYDFMQPGMHTSDQFQQALRDFQANRTKVVLFETSVMEKLSWTSPDTPLELLAAKDPIEEYIFEHYQRCAGPLSNGYWRFLIMVRKDLPCLATSDVKPR